MKAKQFVFSLLLLLLLTVIPATVQLTAAEHSGRNNLQKKGEQEWSFQPSKGSCINCKRGHFQHAHYAASTRDISSLIFSTPGWYPQRTEQTVQAKLPCEGVPRSSDNKCINATIVWDYSEAPMGLEVVQINSLQHALTAGAQFPTLKTHRFQMVSDTLLQVS